MMGILVMVNGDVDAVDDGDDLQVEGMAKLVAFLKEGWGVSFQGNRALVLNVVHGLVSLFGEDLGGRSDEMERGRGGARSVANSFLLFFIFHPRLDNISDILVSQFHSSATIKFCLHLKRWSGFSGAMR